MEKYNKEKDIIEIYGNGDGFLGEKTTERIKKIKQYNLNNEDIYLSKYASGFYNDIVVKVGRKTLILKIQKTSASACVTFTDKKTFESNFIFVKENYCITKKFVENIKEIRNAVKIVEAWKFGIIL
ncbi:MAG: hypothetical protein RR540_00880 [Oscillospiraceae bacterium]